MVDRSSQSLSTIRAKQRLLVVAAITAVVIVVGTTVCYGVYHARMQSTGKLTAVQSAARSAIVNGDYAKAYITLKAARQYAQTTPQKVSLLSDLAAAAASTGRVNEAIDYYSQKQQLAPKAVGQDALLVAPLYERLGQNDKALEQYRLAEQYIVAQPKSNSRDTQLETVNAIIRNLGGAQ